MSATPELFTMDEQAQRAPSITSPLDREAYVKECEQRWHGPALADAKRNWSKWQELRPVLAQNLLAYHRGDEGCDQSLTGFLWNLQGVLQPDKSRLDPFIDFEDRYQKCFLRRGLVIYCAMILRLIEGNAEAVAISREETNNPTQHGN